MGARQHRPDPRGAGRLGVRHRRAHRDLPPDRDEDGTMNLLGRLVALWSLLRAWRRRHDAPPPGSVEADPTEWTVPEDRRAETLTAGLLWASGVCGVAFLVLYVVWDDTRILGVAGGLCLLFLAAALMFASARVVPQEIAVEERAELDAGPEEHRALTEEIRRGGEGISRRKLLAAAGTASAAGLGIILVTPAASLGPRVRRSLTGSPWETGRRLVDEDDQPIRADDLDVGSFTTAFPEGADKRDLGAPVIVIRVRPGEVQATPRRADLVTDWVFAHS